MIFARAEGGTRSLANESRWVCSSVTERSAKHPEKEQTQQKKQNKKSRDRCSIVEDESR